MGRIIQYHPSIISRDAIGNSIVALGKMLDRAGKVNYFVCHDERIGDAPPGTIALTAFLKGMTAESTRSDDILIVHFSFFDASIEAVASLPIKKILVYHNVTPGSYFRQIRVNWLADACDAARVQLGRLSDAFDLAVGDSAFNTSELKEMDFKQTTTIPVFCVEGTFRSTMPCLETLERTKRNADLNLLFVGRFVPNKSPELVVSTLAAAAGAFSGRANLHLVGKIWDGTYFNRLIEHARSCGVLEMVKFYFDAETSVLKSLYIAADAFVSMSSHEGFMVPILEAFSLGCPVIASSAGAIEETMGGAGLLMDAPDPVVAAGLACILKMDTRLRSRIVVGQARRAAYFREEQTFRSWSRAITAVSESRSIL